MVKKLVLKLILLAVISTVPLVAYNVVVDPYMVLRKDYDHMFICPNERYVKTDYILKNPDKYDSYLFGSSRVSQIPVALIDKTTGDKFYNMTYIAGTVPDHLEIIKLFVKRNVTIKNILIGLDYYSFSAMPVESSVRDKMYPETLREKIDFYYTYLTLEPDSSMLKEVKFDGKEASYDLTSTGGYHFINKERLLKLHPEKHAEKFKQPFPEACVDRSSETLAELGEIIRLCGQHDINVGFFINPDSLGMYLCENEAFLEKVRRQLSLLTDYWDFSGANPITENVANYIDPIHYREQVGRMMVERMYHIDASLPPDFGVRVSKSNVGPYVEKMAAEYRRYKKRVNQKCVPCKRVNRG